ncbi:MAG: hypothetical protein GY828_06910 [Candidatus Gracilibacteria bacterium]|nr:hypothetical protein [Candidatus Gracilibacteria bacterium]
MNFIEQLGLDRRDVRNYILSFVVDYYNDVDHHDKYIKKIIQNKEINTENFTILDDQIILAYQIFDKQQLLDFIKFAKDTYKEEFGELWLIGYMKLGSEIITHSQFLLEDIKYFIDDIEINYTIHIRNFFDLLIEMCMSLEKKVYGNKQLYYYIDKKIEKYQDKTLSPGTISSLGFYRNTLYRKYKGLNHEDYLKLLYNYCKKNTHVIDIDTYNWYGYFLDRDSQKEVLEKL